VYKLLHQAAMGSEHAAPEEALARAWLDRELSQMGPGPAEGVVDPISPDGEVVRVHLRPFVGRRSRPPKTCGSLPSHGAGPQGLGRPLWNPRFGRRSWLRPTGPCPLPRERSAPSCKRWPVGGTRQSITLPCNRPATGRRTASSLSVSCARKSSFCGTNHERDLPREEGDILVCAGPEACATLHFYREGSPPLFAPVGRGGKNGRILRPSQPGSAEGHRCTFRGLHKSLRRS
jgi:hypothetical protein